MTTLVTAQEKGHCIRCQKHRATVKCGGCTRDFCRMHMGEHQYELNERLRILKTQFDQLTMDVQEDDNELLKDIDYWEQKSIEKIHQLADELRQQVFIKIESPVKTLQDELKRINDQVRLCQQEEDFADIEIEHYSEELERLKQLLNNRPTMRLQYPSSSFIDKIELVPMTKTVQSKSTHLYPANPWVQKGLVITGKNGGGSRIDQLNNPWGLCVTDDDDQDQIIYIADGNNHRVIELKTRTNESRVVAGGNGQGNRSNQLNCPTDVIIDKDHKYLIICDGGNRRIVRWSLENGTKEGKTIISNIGCWGLAMGENNPSLYVVDMDQHAVRRYRPGDKAEGVVVAGGNGSGSNVDQLSYPRYICVDRDHSIYVSDERNNRVVKWMKDAREGIVVAGGYGQGNGLTQLHYPHGIVIDAFGYIYVSDWNNHRIVRWHETANAGQIIIQRGKKTDEHQLSRPSGLSFDRQKNLFVIDNGNQRLQKFNIDQKILSSAACSLQ